MTDATYRFKKLSRSCFQYNSDYIINHKKKTSQRRENTIVCTLKTFHLCLGFFLWLLKHFIRLCMTESGKLFMCAAVRWDDTIKHWVHCAAHFAIWKVYNSLKIDHVGHIIESIAVEICNLCPHECIHSKNPQNPQMKCAARLQRQRWRLSRSYQTHYFPSKGVHKHKSAKHRTS